MQDALYKKDASVTGLDFGIISSSFINHMIYAYMDASKQVKQEREALKVYNREIADLKQNAITPEKFEKLNRLMAALYMCDPIVVQEKKMPKKRKE